MTYKELEEKATPRPWKRAGDFATHIVAEASKNYGKMVCDCPDSGEGYAANATLIVHCVNHFGAVVEALERIDRYMRGVMEYEHGLMEPRRDPSGTCATIARAVLAAATNTPDIGKEGDNQ